MKKRFVIGVTGGIATGKSTVMARLKRKGIPTLSADDLVHVSLKRGGAAYARVVHHFGQGILTPAKDIDRRRLGEIVFKQPAARKQLQRFIHPYVLKEIQRFIRRHHRPVAVDIPLLFEARYEPLIDHIVVVSATHAQQIKRQCRRNHLSSADARRRIRAQWPLAKKRRLADSVLDNSGSPAELARRFNRWFKIRLRPLLQTSKGR